LTGPTPRKLLRFLQRRLRLGAYLRAPGDGRRRPQIPARSLLWAILIAQLLREVSFHAVEALVRSRARRALGLARAFGDDALGYFTERLDPEPTRRAIASVLCQAKRNKAFDDTWLIGLVIDGTGAGRCRQHRCWLCHPVIDAHRRVTCYLHHFCMASVAGAALKLPVDVEPYGPGDCEYNAGQRLLRRVVGNLGARFAQFVVADGEFATAPFLHAAGEVGLRVIARLKGNLPELYAAAQARFANEPPHSTIEVGKDRVELWDADDFLPWETLRWPSVRVLRYRQYKPDGTLFEAYWLTDLSSKKVGGASLYRLAKSRWGIENEGFNDGKTRHGMQHISRHNANALLMGWLMAAFAMTIERLYRVRYARRGTHPALTPIEFCRLLRLALSAPVAADTS
jgi:hypothetical protein